MRINNLLGATALTCSLTLASAAVAQTSPPKPPTDEPRPVVLPEAGAPERDSGGEITVTGSRIRRAGYDTLEPATVVSDKYLEARGLTNIADALNEIPGFGVGVTPEGNQSGFGVGQNFVNRFGLGSARTLTLVNGRRFVSTNAASIFGNTPGLQVDLNVIPAQLVDRIENLAIGGAPTYGSDAIAGTVNVILKRNYEGVSLWGTGGITERGDNGRLNLSLLAGHNYNDGRGNITIAASYDRAEGVLGSKRDRFRDAIGTGTNPLAGSPTALIPGRTPATDGRVSPNVPFNTGNADGIANSIFIRNARIFSLTGGGLLLPAFVPGVPTTIANGLPRGFGAVNTLLQFDPSGNLVSFNPGIPFGPQNASGGDGFNLIGETQQITSQLERITGNVMARYELFDNVSAFFEGTYYFARGRELIDQSIYNATLFGATSSPLTFQANDPRLTPQAKAQLASLGVSSFRLSRASRDLVNNNASSETNVYRAVAGIEGNFEAGGRHFNFEATANFGRSSAYFTSAVLDQQRFVNAINVTQNGAGQIVCNPNVTAATNVAPGEILPIADASCVPLDVFGEGRPSAAARAYVTGTTTARAILEQQVYNVNFGSSDVLKLWSGPVGFNVGYEHRVEYATFKPDAFQRAGRGRSVPIGSNTGSFNTDEVYGEIVIPLVSRDNNIPLVETLEIEGKGRYVNNTVNGGFWSYTYGGRWRPVEDIEFRGNYTRSLRAPSVVELFTPVSPAFNQFPDPCDSRNVASGVAPAVRQRNCAAFYASYGLDGPSFQSLAASATVPVTSGGNPNLANEEGRSYTFGVVFRPRFIPRFRAAVDWNRIRITGNIASLTNANIAEGCYDNPDFDTTNVDNANRFCSLIARDRNPADPTRNGQLSNVPTRPGYRTNFVNGAFIEMKGLTAEMTYNFPLDGLGIADSRIDLSGNLFYLYRLRSSNTGVTVVETAGQIGNPEFQGQANVGFTYQDFGLDLQANYQTSSKLNNLNNVESLDILKVPSVWTFNLSTSIRVIEGSLLRLTVSNLFDKDAPFPLVANGLGAYDFLGRRFAVSFQHKF